MFRQSLNKISKFSLFKHALSSCTQGEKDNLTAVLYGIGDMRLEQRRIPVPKKHQVLLQMESVGICGSDVHFLVHGKIGPYVVEKPMVIGHEASGTVVETGKNVRDLKPGDRVAIEPGVGCRMCGFCKGGRYNLCPEMIFCATPPIDGNLARYFVHDADFCFKLPNHLTLDEGALMEPLSVGVHCCKRANLRFGDVVLIMGAGPIGLVTMFAAKAMGASTVLITDIMDFRLAKAEEFGADCVFKMQKEMSDEDTTNEIKKVLGEDPDVTIDCSGAEQCIKVACQVTKTGGVVVLAGLGKFDMVLPLASAIFREVDIRGIFRYNNDYPTSIEMVKTGKVDVKPLITHHFKIEDTIEAFQTAQSREGNPIKIMIHANKNWDHCK